MAKPLFSSILVCALFVLFQAGQLTTKTRAWDGGQGSLGKQTPT